MPRWLRLGKRHLVREGAFLGRHRRAWGALLLFSVWLAAGCESDSFVPPPPEELRGVAEAALPPAIPPPAPDSLAPAPGAAKSVEVILSQHIPEDSDVIKSAARVQAGLDKVRVKIDVLGENPDGSRAGGATPAEQLELVRAAAARRPLALVVEPADPADPKLLQTLEEARAQGLPVVVIGTPISGAGAGSASASDGKPKAQNGSSPASGSGGSPASGSGSARPIIVVAAPSFRHSAHQLVASAMRNAKNAHLNPKDGAIILINKFGDSFLESRVAALYEALKDAGIATVEEVHDEQQLIEPTAKLLTKHLEANPKLVLVFSTDTHGTTIARQVVNELVEKRPFIIAGYTADDTVGNVVRMGTMAAAAEFAPVRLIRRAINSAVAAARGKEVPARIETEVAFHDSAATTGAPPNVNPRRGPPTPP
jgi:ABC-type sugar transport system substrate-binding protein